MGKIRDRLKKRLLNVTSMRPLFVGMPYIEAGDPAALAQLMPLGRYDYWHSALREVLDPLSRCDDEDRRAVHLLARAGAFSEIAAWACQELPREKPGQDLHGALRQILTAGGVGDEAIATLTARYFTSFHKAGQANSAGRFVLGLDDARLAAAVSLGGERNRERGAGDRPYESLLEFLFTAAPERLDVVGPILAGSQRLRLGTSTILLERGGGRFEDRLLEGWRRCADPWVRFEHCKLLVGRDPARYRAEALALCRADLASGLWHGFHADDLLLWMISTYGADAADDARGYLERDMDGPWQQNRVMNAAVKAMGRRAIALPLILINNESLHYWKQALTHLVALDDGTHDDLIRARLQKGIAETRESKEWQPLAEFLRLAAAWRVDEFIEPLWSFSDHPTKLVRDASARALGRAGASLVPRALPLLKDRKKERRGWAVTLLATVGSVPALQALEDRLDEETDEDLRDAMLLALDAARASSGREITREDMDQRVRRTAKKLGSPVAGWLDESRLPTLRDTGGEPLGADTTRYLLYRQSRGREIVPDVEARPLYSMIDRASGADFALEIFQQFAATKADAADRWALAVAGLLGDDRIVPGLNALIQQWGDSARGKMAEYGVQALALIGTDAALTLVDALSLRYRVKNKNIGAAAVEAFAGAAGRRGISVDELGDLVVPWLGFQPGQPRIVEAGARRFQVSIGAEGKLVYRDLDKNKPAASLPKSAPREVLDQLKNEAAILKEVSKGQKARIENLMVRQHRWPVQRWGALFLAHPLLFPFATSLIWGAYDGGQTLMATFRALEDRSLTTQRDETYLLDEAGSVGIVHPLELDEATRSAWQTHLSDYEIIAPFPQLDRPVIAVKDDESGQKSSREFHGATLNALTFRSRAEKLGWTRGSVNDGGCVESYRKVFAGAGVEAFVGVDGLFMGIGSDETITLADVLFVRAGTVRVGGYVYDMPGDPTDPRLLAFGEVPPVVFSEVMGELARIAGQPPQGAAHD